MVTWVLLGSCLGLLGGWSHSSHLKLLYITISHTSYPTVWDIVGPTLHIQPLSHTHSHSHNLIRLPTLSHLPLPLSHTSSSTISLSASHTPSPALAHLPLLIMLTFSPSLHHYQRLWSTLGTCGHWGIADIQRSLCSYTQRRREQVTWIHGRLYKAFNFGLEI